MNSAAHRIRQLPCGCREDAPTGITTYFCAAHGAFETDITTANNLIAEWGRIAASIARQCKWRPRGQCLIDCLGLAVCDLAGLIPVDAAGHPYGFPLLSEKLAGGLRLKTKWAGKQTKLVIKDQAGQVVFRGTINLSFWSKIKVALDSLGKTESGLKFRCSGTGQPVVLPAVPPEPGP